MIENEDRYSRQRVLPELGDRGQQRLADSTVLVIGLGALGSTQAQLLARAGVGRLMLVDRDVLELNNLQRQVLYTEHDVAARLPKAVAAREHLQRINSTIRIESTVADVNPGNLESLLDGVDLVLDGTDNFETRYLVNDACVKAGLPWIYGGVIGISGMALVVVPRVGPCLRCVFPDPPPPGSLPTCDTAGVLNTAPALVAALQVTEAFRLLVGETREEYRLVITDLWLGSVHRVAVSREPECPCCGLGTYDYLEGERTSWTTSLCGRNAVQITPADPAVLDLEDLAERLRNAGTVQLTGHLLQLELERHTLVIFPDGRVLIQGTQDESEARSLYARYLGS